MSKYLFLLIILHVTPCCQAQSFEIKNGEQISVSKGTAYLKVLMTEGTDVFALKIENTKKKLDDSYYLCRYDKNMNKLYESDLSKHIGDRFMFYAGALQGRIYVFTSETKKQKFFIYGIEIDKTTGKNIGEEKILYTYSLLDKFDRYTYMIKPDADSANWIVAATSDNPDDYAYYFSCIDVFTH